jgi:hypothetical protein
MQNCSGGAKLEPRPLGNKEKIIKLELLLLLLLQAPGAGLLIHVAAVLAEVLAAYLALHQYFLGFTAYVAAHFNVLRT